MIRIIVQIGLPTLILAVSGCAHSIVVPFEATGTAAKKNYAPTIPEDIGIYRVMRPFKSFVELGLISYRAGSPRLDQMYAQIRKDAALYGAQAVVDVKVTGETHTQYQTQTHCRSTGTNGTQECSTVQVPVFVSTYLIVGSMIREKT